MKRKKGGDANERGLARKKGGEKLLLLLLLTPATEQYLYWHSTAYATGTSQRASRRALRLSPLEPEESIDRNNARATAPYALVSRRQAPREGERKKEREKNVPIPRCPRRNVARKRDGKITYRNV